ncbi:hypothetical protein SLS63_007985 [Diaporthe eres]|uniref:Cytochrome P450 n=1 Tax=Diaporthe eres TaxID=83184 RepID=A0ABR1P416_DIAER
MADVAAYSGFGASEIPLRSVQVGEVHAMHQEYGKTFVHVTPKKLEVRTADLDVIRFIYSKRKSFEKAPDSMPITLLNPSITSVTGADWQRHRRITAPPFNEQNMQRVWFASLRQAVGLCDWWISNKEGIEDANGDTMALALNVLASAGLGHSWPFVGTGQTSKDGVGSFSTEWRATLLPILTSVRTLALTPRWLYDAPADSKVLNYLVPGFVRDHVLRAKKYRGLMRRLVAERKAEVASGEATDSIFLNAMIARSEDMQRELEAGGKQGMANMPGMHLGGMSDEELLSSIFAYHIGGLETTAQWTQRELDMNFEGLSDPLTWDYENFQRLKRCRAVFYEMLRLFPGIPDHQKDVLGEGAEIPVEGRTIFVPAGSEVFASAVSVHVMPEYWGPESKEFRPARWITASNGGGAEDEGEQLAQPPVAKETFFPWSLGQRDCPGKKFSQVEFVAVLACVLRFYRIECVPIHEGETLEEKRSRVWAWSRDSGVELSLNFKEPTKYGIRLARR